MKRNSNKTSLKSRSSKPVKGLTEDDFNDLAAEIVRKEGGPPSFEDQGCSRATQTVGKVPKVYLTQAWKYTKMPSAHDPVKVDFRHYPRIGSMRHDLYGVRVPEGIDSSQLQQEPSFLRILHENARSANKSLVDNFNGVTRLQMATGVFGLDKIAQTDTAVDAIPFAKDDLWFAQDPDNVEAEMTGNKAVVKEFVKTSGVFTSRDIYLMLQSRKARRKPVEGLVHSDHPHGHLGLDHEHKEAEIHSIEQYQIASDRRDDYLKQPQSVPVHNFFPSSREETPAKISPVNNPYIFTPPANSRTAEKPPEMREFKDPSVENLTDAMDEIFHYAKRQKTLLNADSMVIYTVIKIDGPIVVLEKYPPKRISQYIQPVPESLQYGIPAPAMSARNMSDVGGVAAVPNRNSADSGGEPVVYTGLPEDANGSIDGTRNSTDSRPSGSSGRRTSIVKKEADPDVEITIDLRNTGDLLSQVFIRQTWFRVVNLRAFLEHGCPFVPQVPDNPKSSIIIPIGIHEGRMLGFVTFIRAGKKPKFTEFEAEVTFRQIGFMLRHRYYTGVRNEQRKAEMNMLKQMHSVLRLDDKAVDEFLHYTLMLTRILCDAERASGFLVNSLSESLCLDSELIPYHLETGALDSVTGRPSYRKGHDIRMSVNSGIVGCSYRHRKTYASSGTQDAKHFFSEIDRVLANKTECLVCVPFLMGTETYGLVEVLNKKSSSEFSQQDVAALHLNSVFPALGILLAWYRFNSNKQEYLLNIIRAKTAYMRNRRLHRVTRLWRPNEPVQVLPRLPDVTADMAEPQYFYLDNLPEMAEVSAALIKDLLTHLQVDDTVLWNFVLHVRDSHFRSRFKDWKYAFASLQAVYSIIKKSGDFFTDDDKLILAVAAICHGIDHFWFNGALTEGTDMPEGFAHVYGITTPEVGTAYRLLVLLRQPSTNVFHSYHSIRWRRIQENARHCVLATQIPTLLKRVSALMSLIDGPSFRPGDLDNRQHIRELVTAAASLHFVCRTPDLYQEITRCAHEEYGRIFSELSSRPGGNFCPRWVVPDDIAADKTAQVDFIRRICLPVFDLLQTLFPETHRFYDGCIRNIEKLEGVSKRLDPVSAQSRIDHAGRRKDRRLNADMKARLRMDLFEEMKLPLDNREVHWSRLEDLPFLWHHKTKPVE